MAEHDNPAEGTLSVDFDDVTKMFVELKSVVLKAPTPREFIRIVQTVTEKIFRKYFELPNARLYKPDELQYLLQHVMDCINNITPAHIPYRFVFEEGQWRLYLKEDDPTKALKPN